MQPVVVADAIFTQAVEPTETGDPSVNKQPSIDRDLFVASLRKVWCRMREGEPFGVTETHITKAIAAAKKVSEEVFLATWSYWLQTCGAELSMPSHNEPDRYVSRMWPVEYFLSSGALQAFAEDVRPFAGMAEDELVRFLVDAQRETPIPISVTDENLAILRGCVKELSAEYFLYRYDGRAMDAFVTEVVVPLAAEQRAKRDEYRRRHEERNSAATKMESKPSEGASLPA